MSAQVHRITPRGHRTPEQIREQLEARMAALIPGARRRYAKSRARHLAWLHEREWRAPVEAIKPEELEALKAEAGKALSAPA